MPVWIFCEQCAFNLKLDDRDGLMHHCHKTSLLIVNFVVLVEDDRLESAAFIIVIVLHSECGKRYEINSVALFQCCQIGISEAYSYDMAYACIVASACAHPEYVMVAPLDVP